MPILGPECIPSFEIDKNQSQTQASPEGEQENAASAFGKMKP